MAERLCLAAALVLIVCATSIEAPAQTARVIDGDTLQLGDRRIRLFGIDAPERGQICGIEQQRQTCGEAATQALEALVAGHDLNCREEGRDRYGRSLATCYVDDQDLGGEMVRLGHAFAYLKYSNRYSDQETEARNNRRGVWATILPEAWRRNGGGNAERDPVRRQ